MSEALAEHRRLLREAFARHGGVEVDTQGDAFFYAFPSAAEAIEAAGEGQRALSVGPIRVRMGLHTGRPHVGREGYVGEDVHLAARIAAAGHGGQVLVSQATRALVDGELADLGEHRVKDFSEPVWIFQLGEERFPPLKTISNTNLPRPASSFVGREREVADVVELLQDGARLVTLSGPGGSGKTRLAIESAAELVPEFRNGVFWIGLAALRDPTLVAETVAQTLGAKDGLAEHIGERELLLLLDNFEQVVEAAPGARFAARVLPEPPPLGDEPGAVADPGRGRVPGAAAGAAPRRSSSSAPAPGSSRATRSRSSARRLDNLPLAVELAAARTSVLSRGQILERLSQRLDLLEGRTRCRGAPADAAGDDRMELRPAHRRGAAAVRQALRVRRRLHAGSGRNRLRRRPRHAAVARRQEPRPPHGGALLDAGDDPRVRARATRGDRRRRGPAASGTARTSSSSAELAKPELLARSSSIWFDRLEAEHDNIRAVLGDALEHGRTDVALRLGAAIWHFWWTRGYWSEGRRWLESALAAGGESDPQLRFDPLWGAGLLAVWQGDVERGSAVAEEMLALAPERRSKRAGARHMAGSLRIAPTTRMRRSQLYEESARLAREQGDYGLVTIAVNNLGTSRSNRGEYERALELFEESLAIDRERHDRDLLARALLNLGFTTLMLGDARARARAAARRSSGGA